MFSTIKIMYYAADILFLSTIYLYPLWQNLQTKKGRVVLGKLSTKWVALIATRQDTMLVPITGLKTSFTL